VDSLLNTRAYLMAEIDNGNTMGRLTGKFAKLTGINWWNSNMKMMAGFTAQNRFIMDMKNFDKLSPKRKELLKGAGIDQRVVNRFMKHQEHFEKIDGGGWVANTGKWTNEDDRLLFNGLLTKDVNNTIVTPGLGDKPLFMHTEAGRTMLQFKSFFLAAHNQMFLPMLQQFKMGDANIYQGAMAAIMFGMMSEYARLQIQGSEERLASMTYDQWIRAGIDRSGISGVSMELFNIAEKLAEGRINLSPFEQTGSRYESRTVLGAFGGPTAQYGESIINTMIDAFGKDMDAKTIHRTRMMTPYQNHFALRRGFDEIERIMQQQEWFNDR
jgi:hypothetical protein